MLEVEVGINVPAVLFKVTPKVLAYSQQVLNLPQFVSNLHSDHQELEEFLLLLNVHFLFGYRKTYGTLYIIKAVDKFAQPLLLLHNLAIQL